MDESNRMPNDTHCDSVGTFSSRLHDADALEAKIVHSLLGYLRKSISGSLYKQVSQQLMLKNTDESIEETYDLTHNAIDDLKFQNLVQSVRRFTAQIIASQAIKYANWNPIEFDSSLPYRSPRACEFSIEKKQSVVLNALCHSLSMGNMASVLKPETLVGAALVARFCPLAVVVGHTLACYCVTFDKTDARIITGSDDALVKVWCAKTGRLIHSLHGHTQPISDTSYSPDNSVLASCSLDNTLRFWNLRTGQHMKVLRFECSLEIVQFHPLLNEDGSGLINVASLDGYIYMYKYRIEKTNNTLTAFFIDEFNPLKFLCKVVSGQEIRFFTFTEGGTRFITGGTDGLIRMFSSKCNSSLASNKAIGLQPPEVLAFDCHEGYVNCVSCSRNGFRFVTGSYDGTARIWAYDVEAAAWRSTVLEAYKDVVASQAASQESSEPKRSRILMVSLSSDDSAVITSSNDFVIRVWDTATGRLMHRLLGHTLEVYVLTPHPRLKSVILSAGYDGLVALWDIGRGVLLKSFHYPGTFFHDGQFNSDGTMIILVDGGGALHIFGAGFAPESYQCTPHEQYFETDFQIRNLDDGGNPLHFEGRSLNFNGSRVDNCVEDLMYGVDFPVEPSPAEFELEINYVKNLEKIEDEIYNLEKDSMTPESIFHVEKILRRRKTLKYFDEATIEDEEEAIDESFTRLTPMDFVDIDATEDFANEYLDEVIGSSDGATDSSGGNATSDSDALASDSDSVESIYAHRPHSHSISRRRRRRRRSAMPAVVEAPASSIPEPPLRPDEWPSEWITGSLPYWTPYVPQLKDEIVYFRQGHEAFLAAVPRSKAHFFDGLPWITHPTIDWVSFGTVESIQYFIGPPTWVTLTLHVEIGKGLRKKSEVIKVKYYDLEDTSDFIILKSRYIESASRSQPRLNATVHVIFPKNELFEGYITRRSADDLQFPHSNWQCYQVAWADGSSEPGKCSPWEVLKSGEMLQNAPSFSSDSLLVAAIEQLAAQYDAFCTQVDYDEYPGYLREIAYPVYLQLVLSRLKNGFYRNVAQLNFDLEMIVKNAKKYNMPGSQIYRESHEMLNDVHRFMAEYEGRRALESVPSLPSSSSRGNRHRHRHRIIDDNSDDEDDESSPAPEERRAVYVTPAHSSRAGLRSRKRSRRSFTVASDDSDD